MRTFLVIILILMGLGFIAEIAGGTFRHNAGVWLILLAAGVGFGFHKLSSRLDDLERKIGLLGSPAAEKGDAPKPAPEKPVFIEAQAVRQEQKPAPVSSVPLSSAKQEIIDQLRREAETKREKKPFSFEQQFGARLPVWIGGIALALSGFYLVKYSIDNNLLTPEIRVLLGAIFGAALIGAARYIRVKKPDMADGTRIAQALCGAGIADLYATIFAATSLYHLVPNIAGFVCMAGVTALAVILSLRHGMPIALLGLLGGFVTPGLIGSENPSAITLFIYLYCVIAGLMVVIRKQGWWVLSIPTILGAFIWTALWVFGNNFNPADGICLAVFIVAVSATVVAQTQKQGVAPSSPFSATSWLGYLTFAGALALMAAVTVRSGFGVIEWGFYWLLGLGASVMAYFKPEQYKHAPTLSLALSIAMLAAWPMYDIGLFTALLGVFGLLYGIAGLFLSQKRLAQARWAGLAAASAIGFYCLAYVELERKITEVPHLWGLIAIVLAAVFTQAVVMTARGLGTTDKTAQKVLSIFTLTATAFVSTAVTLELERDLLSVAFAGEILAAAWLYSRFSLESLRLAGKALFVAFVFALLPQFMLLASVSTHSLFGHEWKFWRGDAIPFAQWPMLQLGLPMALLALASWLCRKVRDGRFVGILETTCVLLGALTAYYVARGVFHVDKDVLFVKAGFFERGVMTNIFFVAALGVIYAGRHYTREALVTAGSVLFAVALFRVGWFDMTTHNPLWTSSQKVGEVFLLNALLLPFAMPILWLKLSEKPQAALNPGLPQWLRGGMALSMLFLLITLNVRQLFHGTVLDTNTVTTNAEIYAYSIAWLLLGVGLLFFGTIRQDKPVRIASLVIMLLVIGKVFLYDAGELSGLYRVFSFMGLGLALIGLSWFYTRFVFKKE